MKKWATVGVLIAISAMFISITIPGLVMAEGESGGRGEDDYIVTASESIVMTGQTLNIEDDMFINGSLVLDNCYVDFNGLSAFHELYVGPQGSLEIINGTTIVSDTSYQVSFESTSQGSIINSTLMNCTYGVYAFCSEFTVLNSDIWGYINAWGEEAKLEKNDIYLTREISFYSVPIGISVVGNDTELVGNDIIFTDTLILNEGNAIAISVSKSGGVLLKDNDVNISGMTEDPNGSGATPSLYISGYMLQEVNNLTMENCEIIVDGYGYGVFLFNSIDVEMKGNHITYPGNNATYAPQGVFLSACKNIEIHNNTFDGSLFGVYGFRIDNLDILDNVMEGNNLGAYGISMEECFDSNVNNNTIVNYTTAGLNIMEVIESLEITGNQIMNNNWGVELFEIEPTYAQDLSQNNDYSGNTEGQIMVTRSPNFKILDYDDNGVQYASLSLEGAKFSTDANGEPHYTSLVPFKAVVYSNDGTSSKPQYDVTITWPDILGIVPVIEETKVFIFPDDANTAVIYRIDSGPDLQLNEEEIDGPEIIKEGENVHLEFTVYNDWGQEATDIPIKVQGSPYALDVESGFIWSNISSIPANGSYLVSLDFKVDIELYGVKDQIIDIFIDPETSVESIYVNNRSNNYATITIPVEEPESSNEIPDWLIFANVLLLVFIIITFYLYITHKPGPDHGAEKKDLDEGEPEAEDTEQKDEGALQEKSEDTSEEQEQEDGAEKVEEELKETSIEDAEKEEIEETSTKTDGTSIEKEEESAPQPENDDPEALKE